MAAREVTLADAVVAMLAEGLPDENVVRSDIPVEDVTGFDQRRLYVFAMGYQDVARVSRRTLIAEAPIAVLFAEMYQPAASASATGPIPNSWLDERRATVATLYDLLNETGTRKADRLLGAFWPETCNLATPVDLVRLDQQKVFWSLIEVGYREFRRDGS